MVQLLILISILEALGIWLVARTRGQQDPVAVRLRLDRSGPGSYLVWDIANVGGDPITVTKLVTYSRTGPDFVSLGIAHELEREEHTLVPTDVDWTLIKLIQEQLGMLIGRRVYTPSASDWLYGATNLAFGMVILGLGFFMLMWVIATG